MGGCDRRGLHQHRSDPTTSLTQPVRPRPEEPGEPQPGSASRRDVVPDVSADHHNHGQDSSTHDRAAS